jgi:hypothetical protein
MIHEHRYALVQDAATEFEILFIYSIYLRRMGQYTGEKRERK